MEGQTASAELQLLQGSVASPLLSPWAGDKKGRRALWVCTDGETESYP